MGVPFNARKVIDMSNNEQYTRQAIDPNILSVLDVIQDGKVVSAQTWVELWNTVITHINNIDTYCVALEELRINWDSNYQMLVTVITDFNAKYNAFKDGFVHYGPDEPTNEHTLFWVQEVSDTDDALTVTRGVFNAGMAKKVDKAVEVDTLVVDLTKAYTLAVKAYDEEQFILTKDVDRVTVQYVHSSGSTAVYSGGIDVIPKGTVVTIAYTRDSVIPGESSYTCSAKVTLDGPWIKYASYGGKTEAKYGFLSVSGKFPGGLSNITIAFNEYTSSVVKSASADYAEVGAWSDGNPNAEDRTGYFVAIDDTVAGPQIKIADSNDNVRGAVMRTPGFAANASADKFDEAGELLPQYAYVGLMGLVPVIDNGTCTINAKCMPADDGTAIPSDTNYGYQVVDRVSANTVLVAIEPNADTIYHIYKDIPGERTEFSGEIFNNYNTNKALDTYTHTEGSENTAGCKGFRIINTGVYETCVVGQIAGDASALAPYTAGNYISFQWGQVFDYSANIAYVDFAGPESNYTVFRLDKIPDGFDISDATEGYLWVPVAPEIGNISLGASAHVEGAENKAVQYASHAEGCNNIAASKYAHVEGKNNIACWAAHSEGLDNQSLGLCSHTEGSQNIAKRNNTHAEGTYTQALFDNAHAEGSETVAGTATSGHAAHSEGKKSKALGNITHAEGNETQATADFSHSEGDKSVASGIGSHAENNGKAAGKYSHAEGNATASGEKAHAEGNGSQAKGQASHSEGDSTNAGGKCAHSQGCWTFADGENSTAAGWMSIAKSKNSVASGTYCISKAEGQHAVGRYNEEVTNALFVVGNGTAQNARSNAFAVLEDGSVVLKGAAGYKTFTPAMIDKLYNLLSE